MSLGQGGGDCSQEQLLQQKWIEETPLFLAARDNDVASLCKLLSSDSIDVHQTGPLGESVLHVAARSRSNDVMGILLDTAPEMVNQAALSPLYRGETPLHIAVVNQDTHSVKAMISRGADVSTPRATGTYYRRDPQNLLYFGEHILSFAACTGNEELIRIILRHGADIRSTDSLGNTVFHVLVLQPNKVIAVQVYDLILSHDRPRDGIPSEMIPNNEGLTPIKLAAVEGNVVMFQHLMMKRRRVQWTFGPISSCLYDLKEIDSWGEDDSVLELVLASRKTESLRILDLTPVKQLAALKWNKFGKHYFHLLTVLYLLYVSTFTLCCVHRPLKRRLGNISNPKDTTIFVQRTLQEAYVGQEDRLRLVGEIISVCGALVILLFEIPDILRFGARSYFGKTVLGGPFHVILMTYALLVLVILFLRVSSSDGEAIPMALALILAWCNMMYFARGFSLFGPFTVMIQKMIIGDLLRFCWLMLMVLLGFTAAFHITFQTLEPEFWPHFQDFSMCLFTMFQLFLGLLDIPINYEKVTPAVVKVTYVVYMVLAFLLMVNLLTATMGDTYWRVAHERDQHWRAQVVASTLLLERRIPKVLWPRVGIPGAQYGLGNSWYIRVEDRNESASRRILRYVRHFRREPVEEGVEQESEGDRGGWDSRRERVKGQARQGWELVRRSALETHPPMEGEGVYQV